MSLIVAKKEGKVIHIVGDTKLTYPDAAFPEKHIAHPDDGVIKTTIVHPFIAISFAGDWEAAKIAVRNCRSFNDNLPRILQYLLELNISHQFDPEFLVCVSYPVNKIYSIKEGKMEESDSGWIGSKDGFNEYQKHLHAIKTGDYKWNFQHEMESSLKLVIESDVASVNGFLISVTSESGAFLYKGYMQMYIVQKVITGSGTIGHGTTAEGGYSIHVFDTPRVDIVVVHVLQGNFGIVYSLTNGGLLEPKTYSQMDEYEFSELTTAQFGIRPALRYSPEQKSLLLRGHKANAAGDFEKALSFYDRGLQLKDIAFKSQLLLQKGVTLLNLHRQEEAMRLFNEAIQLDPYNQSKIATMFKNSRK